MGVSDETPGSEPLPREGWRQALEKARDAPLPRSKSVGHESWCAAAGSKVAYLQIAPSDRLQDNLLIDGLKYPGRQVGG